MTTTVAIVAALDTKGEEAALVRDVVEARGCQALVIDVGVLGQPGFAPAIERAAVASAGAGDITELRQAADKARAMATMTRGAAAVAARLAAEGRIDGIIGFGGSAGTIISASAMAVLPIGFPKLIVSTVAAGDTRPYVGTKDVTMMYSVVDIAGLNRISRRVLTNAANAIAGMALAPVDTAAAERPIIAASMFGNTTACVDQARAILDDHGYEVLVFHATGTGGQTMESVIADGFTAGSLDLTTTEWADELCGGVFAAGPARLDAAAAAGVPQVVAPGCLDMVNFAAMETVPERYRDRRLYQWNANVTLMRTTPEENRELGRILAEKVNRSRAPAAVVLPLGGVSQLDSAGGEFWWPEADAALFDAIRRHLRPGIGLVELEHNINDVEFSTRAANQLLALLDRQPRAAGAIGEERE